MTRDELQKKKWALLREVNALDAEIRQLDTDNCEVKVGDLVTSRGKTYRVENHNFHHDGSLFYLSAHKQNKDGSWAKNTTHIYSREFEGRGKS